MESIYIVSGISFFSGALGYLVIQLWWKPIHNYQHVKRTVGRLLAESETAEDKKNPTAVQEDRLKQYRVQSGSLFSVYDKLPVWYKIKLKNRGEKPETASEYLMKLGNIKNDDHASKKKEQIKDVLKL